DHCSRSLECLPRALLRFGFAAPVAAWCVGLAFRAAAAIALVVIARRSRGLAAAANGLFLYYLYLHAYLQTWYLLSLLPRARFADGDWPPALRVFLGASVLYYAVRIPFNCDLSPPVVALKELAEGLIVLTPPTVALLRARRA